MSILLDREMGHRIEVDPEPTAKGRYGYDVDDTLVKRARFIRFCGMLAGRISGHSLPDYTIETLPELDHTPVEVSKGGGLNLRMHMGRVAIPGVPEKLQKRDRQGIEQFAISGRKSTTLWHNETTAQLAREGYPIPADRVILTPRDEKGVISKAVIIRRLNIRRYADDDLGTQLFLAFLHPEVQFDWIKYGLRNTAVDKVALAARPNLHVVPVRDWMNSAR